MEPGNMARKRGPWRAAELEHRCPSSSCFLPTRRAGMFLLCFLPSGRLQLQGGNFREQKSWEPAPKRRTIEPLRLEKSSKIIQV